MGVSMGTSGFYVVVSLVPRRGEDEEDVDESLLPRPSMFIGKVADYSDLDDLIKTYNVRTCLISPQAEPHLVQKWARTAGYRVVQLVIYTNDGLSEPNWDKDEGRVTVDRTVALNSAYEEIRSGLWWIPEAAHTIDNGNFYAQMKAPTRVRDSADGTLRYRWVETGPLEHYRHAHAFDHIGAEIALNNPPAFCMGMAAGVRESFKLLGDYDRFFFDY